MEEILLGTIFQKRVLCGLLSHRFKDLDCCVVVIQVLCRMCSHFQVACICIAVRVIHLEEFGSLLEGSDGFVELELSLVNLSNFPIVFRCSSKSVGIHTHLCSLTIRRHSIFRGSPLFVATCSLDDSVQLIQFVAQNVMHFCTFRECYPAAVEFLCNFVRDTGRFEQLCSRLLVTCTSKPRPLRGTLFRVGKVIVGFTLLCCYSRSFHPPQEMVFSASSQ